MKKEKFSKAEEAFEKKKGSFLFRGWIKRKRQISGKVFLVFRDASAEIQCVIEKGKVNQETWKNALDATIESSAFIGGTLNKDKRAPGGVELQAGYLELIGKAQTFPIQRDLSEDFLLNVRHLWLRSTKMRNILKVRATLFQTFHEFMRKNDFVEVHTPTFVSGMVEGGSTLFEVPYFGKKVFLTQSGQFYNEVNITAFERVYTVQPSFRAEKSRTVRHLTEFWHAEAEAAWWGLGEIIEFEEEMLKYMCREVAKRHPVELKYFKRDPKDLIFKGKFKRFTYDEILEEARKKFPKLKYGSDLGEKEEREITREFRAPVIVTHYPASLKPFYHRPDPKNPEVVLCNDILAPEGYGEIVGSGERCWKLEELKQRMKAENLNPKDYEWYLDLRRYGSIPHSGFGLGIGRMLTWILKLPSIRDAVPYPRTMNRYYP